MARRRSKRRRPTREDVRKNAEEGGSSGQNWLNLPKGVGTWAPEKRGRHLLDFLPYEVVSDFHPDRQGQKGMLWYKRPFKVHHNVGVTNESIVCPTSVNQRCPICEDKASLMKEDRDKHEDEIRALGVQNFVAFNIVDPDDEEKVAIFALSTGKFWQPLEAEIKEGRDDDLFFWDVGKDEGRTIEARFSDATFEGRKYLKTTRIDFRPREAMDEDEVLGKVVCLDTMFNVLPYDKIKAMFLQIEEEEEAPKDQEEPTEPDDDNGDNKEPEAPEETEEKEPEAPESEEDGNGDEEPWKVKDRCQAQFEDDWYPGAIQSIDDEGVATVLFDDGEEAEVDVDDLTVIGSKEFLCKACEDTKKNSKGEPCPICSAPKTPRGGKKPPAKPEGKKPKEDTPTCPIEGGTFAKSVDDFEECDDCPHWQACDEAHKD